MDTPARAISKRSERTHPPRRGIAVLLGFVVASLATAMARGEGERESRDLEDEWIEIVSIPPGARIEVDGTFVGHAPVWYLRGRHLPDTAPTPIDPRRERTLTIAAFPTRPNQRAVARGFSSGPTPRGRPPRTGLPRRVVLDLTLDEGPSSLSPSGIPDPAARPPKREPAPSVEADEPEPAAAAFLGPWARDAHRAAREALSRGTGLWLQLAAAARRQTETAYLRALGMGPMPGEGSARRSGASLTHRRGLDDPWLTGLPGTILLGSVGLLGLLGILSVGRLVVRMVGEWVDWEWCSGRRCSGVDGAGVHQRYALYCAALGLPPEATFEEVKRRYRELAIRYHPDKSRSGAGAEEFKRISHAYAVLERLWPEEAASVSRRRRNTG